MANYPNYFQGMQSAYPQNPQYYQGMQGQYGQTSPQLNGRMVTSREEALGVPVDYTMPIVMPDLAHGVVYIKLFNQQTGAADLIEYRRAETQRPQDVTAMLEERVKRLETAVRGMMQPAKEDDKDV